MKWKTDLIKDIRFGDRRDDSENYARLHQYYLPYYHKVDEVLTNGSYSGCNKFNTEQQIDSLGDSCKCIVEIGVDRRGRNVKYTSTDVILNKKPTAAMYLGVDLLDKSHLNSKENNVHTIQVNSSCTDVIINHLNSLGRSEIDFLFIDGWHSINQVYADWELTRILSPRGIVAFHDTAYHPGPHLFIGNLNPKVWETIPNCCDHTREDYGIGFAWKK